VASKLRDWPIALKLSVVLFIVVLLPLAGVAWLNVEAGKDAVEERERDGLEALAISGARLLEERLVSATRTAKQVANNPAVIAAMGAAPEQTDAMERATTHLVNMRASESSFQNVYLLDAGGTLTASSEARRRPDLLGQNFSWRPYYRAIAEQGNDVFISDVLKSKNLPGLAVYVSAPVRANDQLLGVAVVKLDASALDALLGAISGPERRVWLMDRHGIIVSDVRDDVVLAANAEGSLAFWTVAALDQAMRDGLREERRLEGAGDRGAQIDHMKGIEDRALEASGLPGGESWDGEMTATTSIALPNGEPMIAGFSTVEAWGNQDTAGRYGTFVVLIPERTFVEPFEKLGRRELLNLLLVVIGVTAMLALLIRRVSRRIDGLVDATARVAAGDLSVELPTQQQDELGRLATSFNEMTKRLSANQSDDDSGEKRTADVLKDADEDEPEA
jgi:HAMP domain-containing protein